MILEEYIKQVKPYVEEMFKKLDSCHDIKHLERTMKIALSLCESENGDRLVVGLSAYLHDIHRVIETEQGSYVSPKESLPKVKEILKYTKLSDDIKDKICYCIENHENYNWNEFNVEDINTLILQDADNLDAIGAIGIARAFIYSGANNIPMYDENIKIDNDINFVEGTKEASTLHHFYHKLLRLKDNMNTKTAKKIATKRTEFMYNFINEFQEEIKGIKNSLN